ncbi:MAG TPA: leucine-rich repeat protein [Erysipelotrichaceae bacterium]|nr:leucine-rich repeat protein [Erysipelotrichaceae bacterium]
MKEKTIRSLCFLWISLILLSTSCQKINSKSLSQSSSFFSSSKKEDEYVTVILVKNENYTLLSHNKTSVGEDNHVISLIKGESLSYSIRVANNYYLDSVDYEDVEIVFNGNREYTVELKNVILSIRCEMTFELTGNGDNPNQITYDANGGQYLTKSNIFVYTTLNHPRPNTSIGTNLVVREGYNLIGWNTKQDGSGEHIGLGSRYLDTTNSSFTLYAEWAKYSDVDDFEYAVNEDNEISIEKYNGNDKTVSIPEIIEEKNVVSISSNAFLDNQANTIIFPKTIVSVEEDAFAYCNLSNLYFFDNVLTMKDDAFKECLNLSTVHINAIVEPRYVTADRHATYADKIDNLILSQDSNRIIIMGGSGAYYNVNADKLKEIYPEYEPFNVAINGWFNNYVQLDIVMSLIHENDVLLHVAESCGGYQFLLLDSMGDIDSDFEYDTRLMNCFELNYDLLALADLRKVTHFFDIFTVYNNQRKDKEGQKYTDYTLYANARGDYTSDQAYRTKIAPKQILDEDGNVIREASISNEGTIDRYCYDEVSLHKLGDYYYYAKEKGAKVFFAFACVNKDSLTQEELSYRNIFYYETPIINILSDYAVVLNSMQDVLYDVDHFADSDWHLDYENSLLFTSYLASLMGYL